MLKLLKYRVHTIATALIAVVTFQAGYALGSYRFFGERKKHKKVNTRGLYLQGWNAVYGRDQLRAHGSSSYDLRLGQAFVLVIEITFNTSEDLNKFLDLWRQLADYVARNEPATLAYEAAKADTKPNTLLIFERWGYSHRCSLSLHIAVKGLQTR
jgi:Antibiotic biosynthesis monooxygenase